MEARRKRPDPPAVAQGAARAALAYASALAPRLPLFAGGRSFGGRMTSLAGAAAPSAGLRGLVFFAVPLHPAGMPPTERAAHLAHVTAPMLFIQGARDALANIDFMRAEVARLGDRAELHVVNDADHSFHAPARSGRSDDLLMIEILDRARDWMSGTAT